MRPIVIYHHPCADGTTAAWVAREALGDVELVPARYGDAPPDVTGREVYVVDFSYRRAVLEEMHAAAAKLVVLDHHESARAELEDLPFCIFDMERSGCGLTWDYFHEGRERPALVNYVEDRDLWRWALRYSREVSAWIQLHDLDVEQWGELAETIEKDEGLVIGQGDAALRCQQQLVKRIASKAVRRPLEGGGPVVPIVNSPILQSELGHVLCAGEPYAAIWHIDAEDRVVWSLRSDENGADVSEVARRRGGGGHKHAAGFIDWPNSAKPLQ